MTQSIFKPVVRNRGTGDLYFYEGDNCFQNIRTMAKGTVTDEAAQKTFAINIEATEIINEYPLVAELINKLGLKYDVLSV